MPYNTDDYLGLNIDALKRYEVLSKESQLSTDWEYDKESRVYKNKYTNDIWSPEAEYQNIMEEVELK